VAGPHIKEIMMHVLSTVLGAARHVVSNTGFATAELLLGAAGGLMGDSCPPKHRCCMGGPCCWSLTYVMQDCAVAAIACYAV
jgi:hypothetical protein